MKNSVFATLLKLQALDERIDFELSKRRTDRFKIAFLKFTRQRLKRKLNKMLVRRNVAEMA